MNKELNNEVDNKVMDNGKLASDSDHSDSSSSNNTTLIAEDSTETVQVQPMESLIVSDTQPQQPMVTSGKENVQDDSLRSVSDQSTLSQSCEKISETVTHSITQLKTIGELYFIICLTVHAYITYAISNFIMEQSPFSQRIHYGGVKVCTKLMLIYDSVLNSTNVDFLCKNCRCIIIV